MPRLISTKKAETLYTIELTESELTTLGEIVASRPYETPLRFKDVPYEARVALSEFLYNTIKGNTTL